jgi:hypothetical protein
MLMPLKKAMKISGKKSGKVFSQASWLICTCLVVCHQEMFRLSPIALT